MINIETCDDVGRAFFIPKIPKRIISLCPSQTETLYDLGLWDELVGVTRFCIHPKIKNQNVIKVGGTKDPKIDLIASLNPDLIICEKEENRLQDVLELEKTCPVYVTNVENLPQCLRMIIRLGQLTNKEVFARSFSQQILSRFKRLKSNGMQPITIAYLIWKNPFMAAGNSTFIDSILKNCGLINIYANSDTRYPIFELDELAQKKPNFIFLSSEPYPFKHQHVEELSKQIPDSKIMLVDGEMFSWYGTRMLKASAYLQNLLLKLKS